MSSFKERTMVKQLKDWWPVLSLVGSVCFLCGYLVGLNTKRDVDIGVLPPKSLAAPGPVLPPGPIRPEVKP